MSQTEANNHQQAQNNDHINMIDSLKDTLSKMQGFTNALQQNLTPEQLAEVQTQMGGYKKFNSDMENVTSKLNEAMAAMNKMKI